MIFSKQGINENAAFLKANFTYFFGMVDYNQIFLSQLLL